MAYETSDIEREAVELVRQEKVNYEDQVAFITDRVAFQMRNLIRALRKNYWGVFEEPVDPVTNRRKIWVPLTETIVESVIKNIDLDTKDINFRAKNPDATGLANLVRQIVRNKLQDISFGEKLDEIERVIARDGTSVIKTIPTVKDGKKDFDLKIVDLLNIYIDPTSPSIQEAYRFTERSIMTEEEVKAQEGWINTEDVKGSYGLARTDDIMNGYVTNSAAKNTKYVDVWELWGKIPKRLITGKKDDTEEVEGHMIVSGLSPQSFPRVHLLEENKGLRPYEECWYTKVPGRWHGKGIAEKLFWLQLWINIIVNVRINRAQVSQLGIFKMKKGAGITPQMFNRLSANGVIPVNDMGDLEQLVIQEASQASYTDEANVWNWSQRVTSAFDVVIGDQLPSSTSATANAIQNQNSKSQFVLIQEGVGMFLERLVKRHVLPIVLGSVTQGDIVHYMGDPEEVRKFDEYLVNQMVIEKLEDMNKQGLFVDPAQVEQERQRAIEQLGAYGSDRYIKLEDILEDVDYDVEVVITNESIDKGILSQNLLTMLQLAPQYQDQVLQQLADIMGLPPFKKAQQMMPQQGGMQGGMPGAMPGGMMQPPSQNPTAAVAQANTLNG